MANNNNDYKYYGDLYLKLNDIMSQMTETDLIMFSINSGMELIPHNEIPYLTGGKSQLMREIAWLNGVNRVYRSDPQKYKAIWQKPDRRIKITLYENGKEITAGKPKDINHNMFQ